MCYTHLLLALTLTYTGIVLLTRNLTKAATFHRKLRAGGTKVECLMKFREHLKLKYE